MILITGGTGFIGSHLVEKLAARGEPFRCLVRSRVPSAGETVRGDLRTGEGLPEALRGVDTIIHLAGVTKALRARDYDAGNAAATRNLLHAAGEVKRFVHVSSLAAVGPSEDGSPVTEDHAPRPLTAYGRSKLTAEEAVRSSAIAARCVIVRPPVVYGPRDTDVFQILKSLSRGVMVQIAGPERYFSAIYAGDLAAALIQAANLTHLRGPARPYFVAHAQPVSWTQLGETAASIMGRPARFIRVPRAAAAAVGLGGELWAALTRQPGIVSREKVREACCTWWTCSPERARVELGFEAPTDLKAGLARTLAWYKEAGWLRY